MISQEYLKQILNYNLDTGIFIWIKTRKDFLDTIAGCKDSNGYIQIRIKGVKYPAAKLAVLYMEGFYPNSIDHINTNITDNSWKNLRVCNVFQNAQNKNVSKITF